MKDNLDPATDWAGRMAKAHESVEKLTAGEIKQIGIAKDLGATEHQLEHDFGLSSDALHILDGYLRDVADKKHALAEANAKAAKAEHDFWVEVDRLNEKTLPPFIGLLGNVEKTLKDTVPVVEAFDSGLIFTAETIEKDVSPALEKIDEQVKKFSLTWSDAMDLVRQGQGTMTGTLPALTDFSATNIASIQRAWDTHNYWGPVVGGSADNPHGTGPDFKALGFKASGGPVESGQPYMVGERGPELFVPKGSGTIVPHGAGVTVNLTVHGSVVSSFDEFKGLVTGAVVNAFRNAGLAIPG
jgi:hypothetical protein